MIRVFRNLCVFVPSKVFQDSAPGVKLTGTELDARVTKLPSPAEGKPFPEGRHSPLLHHAAHRGADAAARGLHPGLHGLDRVRKVHGEGGGGTAARHGFEEAWLA